MNVTDPAFRRLVLWVAVSLGMLVTASRMPLWFSASAAGQESGVPPPGEAPAAAKEPATAGPVPLPEGAPATAPEKVPLPDTHSAAPLKSEVPEINVLELVRAGGIEMAAIIGVSIVALAFAVERFMGLRRHKVIPPELIAALGKLATQKGGLDPRQAYKLCQQWPSTAATVIKTVLLKTGRPNAEVEHAVAEVGEREASRLYANVRWQNLAFNVAPMLGLLGTIQGMIVAFYLTSHLPPNMNKAEHLADGIYRALVNTFAGLAVAIPAAILAHMLEGRIIKLMTELDDFVRGLLPHLERFEGRLRVNREQMDQPVSQPSSSPLREDVLAKKPAVRPQ